MYCHTFTVMNNWKKCSGEALRGSAMLRPGTAVKGNEVGGRRSESVVYVFVDNILHAMYKHVHVVYAQCAHVHVYSVIATVL